MDLYVPVRLNAEPFSRAMTNDGLRVRLLRTNNTKRMMPMTTTIAARTIAAIVVGYDFCCDGTIVGE